MANYGEILDDFVSEDKERIYSNFTNYFNNPTMTKVDDIKKDGKLFSMYACNVISYISNEYKYIICITNKNNASKGTVESLNTIYWLSLQTRRLPIKKYNCITHPYIAKIDDSSKLNEIINRVNTLKEYSEYECEKFPELKITLLHTDKKGATSYQNRGNIISAIETYETIFTFKNDF